MTTVLAYDLGSSSGRLIAGKFDGNTISIKEIHRFNNKPQIVQGHYYWDYPALIKELKTGLQKVDFPAASVGIDTWGVDIGLLNNEYALLSLPFSYRDTHSEPQLQKLKQLIDPFELFKKQEMKSPLLIPYFNLWLFTKNPLTIESIVSLS